MRSLRILPVREVAEKHQPMLGSAVLLGVAWSVSRRVRSAIEDSDKCVSVNMSDSRFNTNLKKIYLRVHVSIGIKIEFDCEISRLSIGI